MTDNFTNDDNPKINPEEMASESGSQTLRVFIGIGLALVLAGLIFAAGFVFGVGTKNTPSASTSSRTLPLFTAPGADSQAPNDVDMTTFWEVWNTVSDEFYYEIPDNDHRMYGAINGMLNSLDDPYTTYIEPEAAEIFREDSTGEYQGIGAYIEQAPQGGVYIIRVIDGAPAEGAGLLAGDIVIAVDGEDVTGYALLQSQTLIRGQEGTPVTLTVIREGESEPLEITIIRGRIEFPTVITEMLDDNIGYVALVEFNAASADRMEEAVQSLIDDGAESIIFDLRNNPGGFLDQSIDIADMFLGEGVVVSQHDSDDNEISHTSHDGDIAEDIPLVILINENSASASEIVAGAIQDHERGTLIGVTSFGKGSVQLVHELSDGSQLRVTYANWYTPNGNTINGIGVTPDIIVEIPDDGAQTDVQLERAIEFLQSGQ